MKKINIIVIAVCLLAVCAVTFTACRKARQDPDYNYRVTGHFANWTSNYEEKFMMTPVAKCDARLKPIKPMLTDAQYIYLYEYTPNKNNAANWNVIYSGKGINVDGIYALKFIRLEKDSSDSSGWTFNMWMPSAEAGGLKNLSPDTLFTPMNRSDEERDGAKDGLAATMIILSCLKALCLTISCLPFLRIKAEEWALL